MTIHLQRENAQPIDLKAVGTAPVIDTIERPRYLSGTPVATTGPGRHREE